MENTTVYGSSSSHAHLFLSVTLVHRPARMNNMRPDRLPNLYGFKLSIFHVKETVHTDKNKKMENCHFCLGIFICVEHYAGNTPQFPPWGSDELNCVLIC